jgi:putative transposase
LSHEQKVLLVERVNPDISISRQAELLDISRASLYYTPRPDPEEVRITRAIDEIYTRWPFYGSRRIKDALSDYYTIRIGRHQVRRLMRLMGLEAIYPRKKPKTSTGNPSHKKYPYLLRGLAIDHPNHVWGTDITYIRLENGWAYLVAIIDWYSRYVVAWDISPTLESDFCVRALNRALKDSAPEIFNSDQGTQFTSSDYTGVLAAVGIRISMDGRGRCMDNIFTERLWRTVKYENVYLKSYRTIAEARQGLSEYFHFYNTVRRHQSLDNRRPAEVYFSNQRSNQNFKNSLSPILSTIPTITV